MATFVDTNIFIHYLIPIDPQRLRRCADLFRQAEQRAVDLETSVMTIAELVWFLQRPPIRMNPPAVRSTVDSVMAIPGLRVEEASAVSEALELFAVNGLNFIDAFNAVRMRRRRIDNIYSYDRDFDRVPGVTRVEP